MSSSTTTADTANSADAATTTSPRPGARRDRRAAGWRRARRTGLRAVAAGAVAALAVAVPAAAAQPTVIEQEIDEEYDVPAEAFPCGVDVTFHEVGRSQLRLFTDADGTPVRGVGHIRVTTTVTSAHGRIVNPWGYSAIIDFEEGTLTRAGNDENIHGGAGGVIVNGSGRTVVVEETGEVLFTAGPLEAIDDNWDEICAVLAP
jgi:hypothetical protein